MSQVVWYKKEAHLQLRVHPHLSFVKWGVGSTRQIRSVEVSQRKQKRKCQVVINACIHQMMSCALHLTHHTCEIHPSRAVGFYLNSQGAAGEQVSCSRTQWHMAGSQTCNFSVPTWLSYHCTTAVLKSNPHCLYRSCFCVILEEVSLD